MDEENTTVKKKGCKVYIPARYILTILAFFGVVNVYAVRTNLSIAVVAMVKHSEENTNDSKSTDTCPDLKREHDGPKNKQINQSGRFDWDSDTQGHLLSAFFYGFVFASLPSGVASAWYGGKWILGWGIFVSGVLTILSPVAASYSPWALFAIRVLLGFGTGLAFPATHCLIGKWVPANERSTQNTIVYNGIPIGTISTLAFSGLLIDSGFLGGWPSVFYVTGVTSCVWFVFWALLVYESPYEHPYITSKELSLIEGDRKHESKSHHDVPLIATRNPPTKASPIPWRGILTSYRVYALCAVHFCNNWGFFTLLTFLPTYLRKVLHFQIKANGFISAMPYISLFVFSSVSCVIVDKIRSLEIMSITTLRKIANSIAFYIPGICLLIIPYVGCHPTPVVTLLSLCTGFNGFKLSGFHVTTIDMSPDFAGVLYAITNTIGVIAGIIAPVFAGRIISTGNTLHNWKIVFLVSAFFYFIGGTIYNVFCTAEEQPWGRSKQPEEESNGTESESSEQKEETKDQ